MSQPPPIISYGPSNQTLIVGTVALLTCETAGSPAPSVRWTKDGAPLQASDRYVVESQQRDGTPEEKCSMSRHLRCQHRYDVLTSMIIVAIMLRGDVSVGV